MSLITNFRELKHGTDYIYMMIESSSFDINMSYENLIIGTFDNIYDDDLQNVINELNKCLIEQVLINLLV